LGFFGHYTISSNSVVLYTSDPISPPGLNVFTSIALSRFNIAPPDPWYAVAGIYRWESYDAGGNTVTHEVGGDYVSTNSAFIPNCRSVTYALVTAYPDFATAQVSLSTY
jgi:hypothetical protein